MAETSHRKEQAQSPPDLDTASPSDKCYNKTMELPTPPASFDHNSRNFSTPSPKPSHQRSDSASSSPSARLARMRASPHGGFNGGNLQLSITLQHPLKSRENSPEYQFPRQSEQPNRTLSPVPTLIHTPRLGYGSSSPPPTEATSPEDAINTPPTTAISSPAQSMWGGHHRRQLSEHAPSYAPSPTPSHLSFEVLSAYSSISPAEKVRQHQRDLFYEQYRRPYIWEREPSPPTEGGHYPVEFKPNADLPFPISEGLRRYYPHAQTHHGFLKDQELISTKTNGPTEFFETFNTMTNIAKQRIGLPNRKIPYRMVMEAEDEDEGQSEHYSSHLGDCTRMTETARMEESELSRANSGIPSYTREFNMGWRGIILPWLCKTGLDSQIACENRKALTLTDPVRSEPAPSTTTSIKRVFQPQPEISPVLLSPSSKDEDNLFSAYSDEIKSQFESLLRRIKRPFCFFILIGGLGLLISLVFYSLAMPLFCANPGLSTFSACDYYYHDTRGFSSRSYANATYPDFPTLMSIESSFEKIVDGAAGGSALARAMKSSEMAVSDLSTVVRYSDLKCRESLSTKLDAFATDAKSSVRALSGWGSKVGGVLDQYVLYYFIPSLV